MVATSTLKQAHFAIFSDAPMFYIIPPPPSPQCMPHSPPLLLYKRLTFTTRTATRALFKIPTPPQATTLATPLVTKALSPPTPEHTLRATDRLFPPHAMFVIRTRTRVAFGTHIPWYIIFVRHQYPRLMPCSPPPTHASHEVPD